MKKTLSTITLAATMLFGATFAHADGIIIFDLADKSCNTNKEGIIIFDRADGIIFGVKAALEGIIIFDKATPCTQKEEGILVGDRTEGILVSD